MITRRDFLKNFILGTAGLYIAPKTLIFDMGANLHSIPLVDRVFTSPFYSIKQIQSAEHFQEVYDVIVKDVSWEWLLPQNVEDPFREERFFMNVIEIKPNV